MSSNHYFNDVQHCAPNLPQAAIAPEDSATQAQRKRVILYGAATNLDELLETFAKHTIYDIVEVWDPHATLCEKTSSKTSPRLPRKSSDFAEGKRPFDVILIAEGEPTVRFEQLLDLGYLFEIAFDMLDLTTRFGKEPPRPQAKRLPAVVSPKKITTAPHNWFLNAWNLIDYWKKIDAGSNSGPNPIREGTMFVTLASNNHIAQATVLIESILRFHPGSQILLCIADTLSDIIRYPSETYPQVTLVQADELGIPNFDQFSFQYARYEFCTSLKPYTIRYAIEELSAQRVIFLDSDTLVCAPFEGLEEILDDHWAIITPHIVQPQSHEDYMPEVCILNGGGINSGIVCVRNCQTGRSMLNWWCDRMYRYGLSGGGLHGDQRWLDLLPGLYSGYYILRDMGYNVAHWNLCERLISFKDNVFWINNNVRLRLFHYAVLDWKNTDQLFRMWASPEVEPYPELVLIVNVYRMLVCQAYSIKVPQREPLWAYELFDNGTVACSLIRTLYHGLCDNLKRFKQPYKASGADSYYEWLNTRISPTTRLTYLFLSILCWKEWQPCYPNLEGTQSLKLVMDILRINHTLNIPPQFFLPIAEPLQSN